MKNSEKYKNFLEIIFLLLITILCVNMTGGGSTNVSLEPEFVKLKEGEGEYSGKIYDDKTEINVDQLSFTGNTSIGGVRKETDDSVNILDFAIMKELRVVNPNYLSKRFSDKEFILVKVVFSSVPDTEEFLVPRNVVICARDARTGQKKAWFLNKIQRITIDREPRKTIIKEENGKEKGWIETIAEKVNP